MAKINAKTLAHALAMSLVDNMSDFDTAVLEEIRHTETLEDGVIFVRAIDGWEFTIQTHATRHGNSDVFCPSCDAVYDAGGDEIGDDGMCIICRYANDDEFMSLHNDAPAPSATVKCPTCGAEFDADSDEARDVIPVAGECLNCYLSRSDEFMELHSEE